MSVSDAVKTTLTNDASLMAALTGGVHNDVEEVSRQNTPSAFDARKEMLPCALIKLGTETPRGPYERSVQTPITIYFYQRQGYDKIEYAMIAAYDLLNEKQIGDGVWNLIFDVSVNQQRDTALDCALGSLRFVAVRLR